MRSQQELSTFTRWRMIPKIIRRILRLILFILIFPLPLSLAQLSATISPPVLAGDKTIVKLELKNTFTNKIESARASLFLLDSQGKMAGQATRWVIGGANDRPLLAPGTTNTFNFVIPAENMKSTNLTARVTFTRIILEGGKLVDPNKSSKIHYQP